MSNFNNDKIPGGKAANLPDHLFDLSSLKEGMKEEEEHTPDKNIQKEIAKDHIVLDKNYYKKLKKYVEKGTPGVEGGSFRGGDPEEMQYKREEKRREAEEAGEMDTGDSEVEEPTSEEIAEAEAEQDSKSQKSIPIDMSLDYRPRNSNGDLLDKQPVSEYKNIELSPPRCGENQFKRWSDVLGFSIPLEGNPWFYLRRFIVTGDQKGAEEAREQMYRSVSSEFDCNYESLSDLAKAGLFKFLVHNHGLLFDSGCFLSKARKGEVIPGHKYIHRFWKHDRWNYDYTDGVHANHGLEHAGNRQGYTIETDQKWLRANKEATPEEAYNYSIDKLTKKPYVSRVTLHDKDTLKPASYIFVNNPSNKSFPIELHKDDGGSLDINRFKVKNAVHRLQNINVWEKHRRDKTIHTELGPDGSPYMYWRERSEKPFVKFAEESPYRPANDVGDWKRFRKIDDVRTHLEKLHRIARLMDVGSKELIKDRPTEPGKEWTGKVENGHFIGRIVHVPVKISVKEHERTIGNKPVFHKESERSINIPKIKWNSSKERSEFVDNLYKEHKSLFGSIATSLINEFNKQRENSGKLPLEGRVARNLKEGLMVSSYMAMEDALASYDPLRTYKDETTGEEKHIKFFTHMYPRVRHAQYTDLPGLVNDLTSEGVVDPDKLFTEVGRVPVDSIDEDNSIHEAADKVPDILHEDIDSYKDRIKSEIAGNYQRYMQGDPDRLSEFSRHSEEALSDLESIKTPDEAIGFHHKWTSPDTGVGEQFVSPIRSNVDEVVNNVDKLKNEFYKDKFLHKEFGHARLNSDINSLTQLIPEEEKDEVSLPSEIMTRIKNENLKTLKDLLDSSLVNPFKTNRAKEIFPNFLTWVRESTPTINKFGPIPRVARKALVAVDILKAGMEQKNNTVSVDDALQQQPDVHYLKKVNDFELPRFLYETNDTKNLVYGTNAPEGSNDYDEVLGSPEVAVNEPTMVDYPEVFDEQGRKLDKPIPQDVEVENNENYDPDRSKGKFWLKKYKDKETGEDVFAYLHRDQLLDSRLELNNKLKHITSQFPKIREWYKTWFSDESPANKVIALFVSLLDQGRMLFSDLDDLKVGDIQINKGNNSVKFHLSGGRQVVLRLDTTPFTILQSILEEKKPDDFLFQIENQRLCGQTFSKFLLDHFGVLPSYFMIYHVSQLFAREFGKLFVSDKFDVSEIDTYYDTTKAKVEKLLSLPEGEIEKYLDPILVESLILAASFRSKSLSKSGRKLEGKVVFQGFPISIETKKGSVRKWYDPHNKEHGETKMLYDYGYIRKTEGADGEQIDVYLGPNEQASQVFVIHQMKAPDFKELDEDKSMLGFNSAKEAKEAYLKHYNNPRFFGSMSILSVDEFREKVNNAKNKGKIIKSWRVASDPAESEEDSLFSQWVFSYPIHEHYYHWAAYRQYLADSEQKRLSKIGLVGKLEKPLADTILFPSDVSTHDEVGQ